MFFKDLSSHGILGPYVK